MGACIRKGNTLHGKTIRQSKFEEVIADIESGRISTRIDAESGENLYLLDTNIARELSGPHEGNNNVLSWLASANDSQIFFSVAVIMELHKGLASEKRRRNTDVTKMLAGERRIEAFIQSNWHKFIYVDQEIAAEWGRLRGEKEQDDADMLIAATANVNNLTVVTRNVAHFEKRVENVLDPFKPVKPTKRPG